MRGRVPAGLPSGAPAGGSRSRGDGSSATEPAALREPDPALLAPSPDLPRDVAPGEIRTQATYRQLTMRGFRQSEAANMTAYLAGLEVHRSPWTLRQVNRLLFLRSLYAKGTWAADAVPAD